MNWLNDGERMRKLIARHRAQRSPGRAAPGSPPDRSW